MINIGSLSGVYKTATNFLKDNSNRTITSEFSEKSSKIVVGTAMLTIAVTIAYGVGCVLFSKNNGSIGKPNQGGNNRPPKRGGGMVRGISSGQRML